MIPWWHRDSFLGPTETKAPTYLEHTLVLRVAGGLQRDVGHGSRLAHDEHLHPLRYLPTGQHRRVHHLPVLERTNPYIEHPEKLDN